MKTIVYPDGSIESTVRADEFVAAGKARYATAEEDRSYWRQFDEDDQRIAANERGESLIAPLRSGGYYERCDC